MTHATPDAAPTEWGGRRRHEVALALPSWSVRIEGDDKRLVDWLIGALSADQLAT